MSAATVADEPQVARGGGPGPTGATVDPDACELTSVRPAAPAGAPRAVTSAGSARARLAPLVEPRAVTPSAPADAGPPREAGTLRVDGPGRPTRELPAESGDRPLPDPTPLCCAMVLAAVEALRGARPLAQLTRWVTTEVYDQLAVRSQLTQRVLGRSTSAHPTSIRRVRLCRIGATAAEATVVVDDGPRVRAVAVRLEGRRGQWRATALEIG
ncbi:Rv3235 family protein [Cellulomonas fimi]|uniref:Energy transducer TonB n=1 Tax=Cellulomonas fimi TaxID=1708 RepID=A0A7Y0QH60_CELFI|nr:Rv3235 family protein [Cellulomonas fimi]NMR20806.1 energy transducer TonB [Cellulomonas fimi]